MPHAIVQTVINLTFAEGRKHNATHFVAIDVDEVISALWLRGSLWWDTLAGISVGSTMYEPGLLCLLELSLNCVALLQVNGKYSSVEVAASLSHRRHV